MAKKKQSRQAPPPAPVAESKRAGQPQKERRAAAGTGEPLRFRDYVLLNVYFDAFCIVQLVLARLFIRETRGLYFFFGMLIIGFLLVSLFDYCYDSFLAQKRAQETAGS
ncbi:MAG: hypothetical protein ACP5UB_01360 [Candidatus Sumerlaeaceae bacterium]